MTDLRPLRVLFLLQRPEAWGNVASLWRVMRDSDDFHPVAWVLPYNFENKVVSAAKAPLMRRVLEHESVPFEEWHDGRDVSNECFDAAIFNHPYDRERPRALWFDQVNARVPVTVYIPYGPVMAGGRKNMRLQFAQPTQSRATTVVARSLHEKAMYGRYCPSGDVHVHVLGQPRFDRLLASLARPLPDDLVKAIGGRRVILWNSHFSFGRSYSQSSNFSTFDVVGPEIFALAVSRREHLCLLWRPHPGLFPAILREGLLEDGDLPGLRRELAQIGIVLDETADHAAAFKASDALLTDVGSFLLDYLVTGKPVLALVNPDGEPLNEESSRLAGHYVCASTPAEVEKFVDMVQAGTGGADLSRALAEHLPMLDGRAGERVAKLILGLCRGERDVPGDAPAVDAKAVGAVHELVPCSFTRDGALPELPPTLNRLLVGLRGLRAEKSNEPAFRKTIRRRVNMIRTDVGEFIKVHPVLMSGFRLLRGFCKHGSFV